MRSTSRSSARQEGVGSALDSKRAELDSARVDLRIAELETSVDVLRERLGRLIGQLSRNPGNRKRLHSRRARRCLRKTIFPPWRWPIPPASALPMNTSAPPGTAPAPSTG